MCDDPLHLLVIRDGVHTACLIVVLCFHSIDVCTLWYSHVCVGICLCSGYVMLNNTHCCVFVIFLIIFGRRYRTALRENIHIHIYMYIYVNK